MKPIDVAIDDYMHVIARTRPWTMAREEEILEAFSEWLYEQPESPIMLHDITAAHVQKYVAVNQMNTPREHELSDVLNNLYRWTAQQGWVEDNPFEVVVS